MQSPDAPLVILPAAGFGRRIGSPESKEILPLRDGEPLIAQAFENCLKRNWPAVLITRKEKTSLLSFAETYVTKGLKLSICLVGETKEWPDSILKSEGQWAKWNLVVLPDTAYEPENVWDKMWEATKSSSDLIVAEHQVEDSGQWGVLRESESGIEVGEKQSGHNKGWGLYMFRRDWGAQILSAQLKSQQDKMWIPIEGCRIHSIQLSSFKDLTRG